MKKFVAILVFAFILTACGAGGDAVVHNHEHDHNGLKLSSTITVDKQITVKASITNESGESIIYNRRCGVPFHIAAIKDDAQVRLIHNEPHENCDDVFDPNDLVEMAAGESLEKEIVFQPEISISKNQTSPAFSGKYNIHFTFETHEKGSLHSTLQVDLAVDKKSNILTLNEAKDAAKTDDEVKEWFELQEKEGRKVSAERAILNDGKWIVLYHAVHLDERAVDRINIQLDAKSGEVLQVRSEILSEALSEGIVQFIKGNAVD